MSIYRVIWQPGMEELTQLEVYMCGKCFLTLGPIQLIPLIAINAVGKTCYVCNNQCTTKDYTHWKRIRAWKRKD